jgi:formate hydrogenlyase transcriptional activator
MSVESQVQASKTLLQQYQALLQIAEAIARHRDLASLFSNLAQQLRPVVKFDGVATLLYDPASGRMRMHMLETQLPETGLPTELPVEAAPGGWVWQTQQPMIIADTEREERFPQVMQMVVESGLRSLCVLPLTTAGRRLGALGFGSVKVATWNEADLEFLQQVAGLVAVAVDNAINFDNARAAEAALALERDRLRLLLEINNAIVSALDLPELLAAISPCLRRVVHHDFAALLVYDQASDQLRAHALDLPERAASEGVLFSMEGTPSGMAFRSRQPVVVNRQMLERLSATPLVKILRAEGVQSGCSLPLLSHDRALGVLTLMSQRDENFSAQDVELLTQIAGQIAIAVENSLNFTRARQAEQTLERKLEHLRLMLEITTAVVAQLDLRELLQVISTRIRDVLGADTAGVGLFDQASNQLRAFVTDFPPGHPFRETGITIPLEGSPGGLAFTTGQPVFLDKPDLARFTSDFVKQIYADGFRSGGSIPLIAQGRKLGVLGVASKRECAFSAEDKELLVQVANQVAIAVDNALNFERARAAEQALARKLEHLRLMLKITNAVVAQLDLQELLQVISPSIREVIGNDTVGVLLFDQEIGQLRAFATDFPSGHQLAETGFPVALEGSPSGLAFTSGQPVFIDKPDFERFHSDLYRQVIEEGYLSGATLPLTTQGRKLGVLGVTSKRERAFSEEDKELLIQIANQVAIAIDNALNFERARQAEQEVKRQFEQLRLMLEVNNAVVSQLDLKELVRVTAACLREVLHHEIVGISLYDPETNQLRAYYYDIPGKDFAVQEGTPIPLEGSIGGTAFTSGQPVFFNRPDSGVIMSNFNRRLLDAGVKSGGCIPLIVHGRKLGVLGVASFREDAFPAEHQQLLSQIASQIAIAVDNALNFERAREAEQEAKQQSDRLGLVLRINNAVVSQLELRELLRVISGSLRAMVHNDTTGIALYDPESNKLRMVMTDFPAQMELVEESYLIPLEGSVMGMAFTSGEPVFLDEFDLERFPSEFTQRSYEAGLRSCGNLPLIAHGRKLGALGVASKRTHAFSAADIELLGQIASQIAIAVENALNFERTRAAEEEAKRQTERLQLMLEINNAVVSQLSLRELVRVTSARLRAALPHEVTGISLYDHETSQFRAYFFDLPGNLPPIVEGTPMPLEGTVGGLAFLSGRPVFLNRYEPEFLASEFDLRLAEAGIKSGGVIPLIAHDQKLGFLGIGSFRENAFSEADQELLCHIANQIAIAVENALNFERARKAEEEAKRESQRRQLLLEINNAVVSHLDLRSLVQIISASLRRISHPDVVGLALYDPDTNQLRAYAYDSLDKRFAIEEGTPIPLESSLSGAAFATGQPIFHDRIDEERFQSDFSKRFRAAGLKSGGVVPLIAHGRKLGTLSIASYREANLNDDEKELLSQVASQVAIAVENALAFREIETLKNKLTSEKLYLEDEIRTEHNFEELIGESPAFRRILKQVETVAPTDSTVLICGETGTGKELIARAIHDLSPRRERTLVKLNCAAIPTGLLESELFGHEKGAFTGAIAQRIGRFELANKGTLFLDEVGDIPLELQSKLLRVLQEQEFERLGSTRTQRVDVRLIAATNCDLEQMVAERKYRSDLYYRLNVFPITIPPLRQRREDIPALTRFFTQKYARRLKKTITAIPAEAMAALTGYHWPGNVRELEHFIERAVILTRGSDLEISLAELKSAEPVVTSQLSTLEDAERGHILRALEETNWVIGGPNGAAARLGMKRTTLQSRIQKLGITRRN